MKPPFIACFKDVDVVKEWSYYETTFIACFRKVGVVKEWKIYESTLY